MLYYQVYIDIVLTFPLVSDECNDLGAFEMSMCEIFLTQEDFTSILVLIKGEILT